MRLSSTQVLPPTFTVLDSVCNDRIALIVPFWLGVFYGVSEWVLQVLEHGSSSGCPQLVDLASPG